jgi:hypothetical protein
MRLLILLLLSLTLAVPVLRAQEVQGPEPGVFVYAYDEATKKFTRTYCSTQQAAEAALEPRLQAARVASANLNAAVQSNVNNDTVAQWLVFFEQWSLWQEWVKQEYGLKDLGDVTFAAVPGTQLRWEKAAEEAAGPPRRNQQGAVGRGAQSAKEGNPEVLGIEGGAEFAGAQTQQAQTPAEPEGPAPSLTIATFLPTPPESQPAAIAVVQSETSGMVQEAAQKKYEVLTAVLDEVDEEEAMRQRREAYRATVQRDITDWRDIILNRESATELDVNGRMYLFSEQPLNRIPEEAINITTPNLTPFDIFNADGTIRAAAP